MFLLADKILTAAITWSGSTIDSVVERSRAIRDVARAFRTIFDRGMYGHSEDLDKFEFSAGAGRGRAVVR